MLVNLILHEDEKLKIDFFEKDFSSVLSRYIVIFIEKAFCNVKFTNATYSRIILNRSQYLFQNKTE